MTNDSRIQLGKNLKEAREKKGLTQAQLAEKINISAASISAYEKGNSYPSLNVLKEIAEECEVSLDHVCGMKAQGAGFEKYSDVIQTIFELERIRDLDLVISAAYRQSDGYLECTFRNETLAKFFSELEDVKTLHDRETINDEMFSLLLETLIKKYDGDLVPF